MSRGGDKNVPHNNTSNNTSNTLSLSLIEEEEKKEIGFVESIEEFRLFLNRGLIEEKYPWKDFESTTTDCWLYYESTGKNIKKQSVQAVFTRWLNGGDPKKREEEKKNWEDKQRRSKVIQESYYSEAESIERKKSEEKRKIAEDFIRENPEKSIELQGFASTRANEIAKGNEKIAGGLFKSIFIKFAYEEAIKQKNGLVQNFT